MVEILLFAVLSVYLAYRLWGVLGTRTGSEKQRQWSRPETIDDNVIILPQKSTGQHATIASRKLINTSVQIGALISLSIVTGTRTTR